MSPYEYPSERMNDDASDRVDPTIEEAQTPESSHPVRALVSFAAGTSAILLLSGALLLPTTCSTRAAAAPHSNALERLARQAEIERAYLAANSADALLFDDVEFIVNQP